MTDLPLPPTTASTRRGKATRFKSGTQHPRWSGSCDPSLVGSRYGWVTITSPHIERRNGYRLVQTRCTGCGVEKAINLDNLESGKTSGCQTCSQKLSNSSTVLGRRYDALIARCTSPKNPAYPRYGGRGITCSFASRAEFIRYVEQHLPHPDYRGVEIDRKNNDGHYEPGNLRLVTRTQNCRNREVSALVSWRGQMVPLAEFPSPYAYTPTHRYARRGLTGEQIIERAWQSVREKRKGWRQLQAKLTSMTS